jgi:hypothetical protein
MFFFYLFYPIKLENRRAEQVLLGAGVGTSGRERWWGKGVGG